MDPDFGRLPLRGRRPQELAVDSNTPVLALIAVLVIVLCALVGSPTVEALVGRKWRPLDRLDGARIARATKTRERLYLVGVLVVVGTLLAGAQLVMVAALLEPNVALVTRTIAWVEVILFVAWCLAMVRLAHSEDRN